MITIASPRVIRADRGGFRVYRPYAEAGRFGTLAYIVGRGQGMCRTCGCTTEWGCARGCSWADKRGRLCSRCAEGIAR